MYHVRIEQVDTCIVIFNKSVLAASEAEARVKALAASGYTGECVIFVEDIG